MTTIETIQAAIEAGNLLKINYQVGKNSLAESVVRPIQVESDGDVSVYAFISGTRRKLSVKAIEILEFSPSVTDGEEPQTVRHFRWLIGHSVPVLFEYGWLISTDEEYIGIYPRTKEDNTSTDKPFKDQFAHMQYIKGKSHQFHVWDNDGCYRRLSAFNDALNCLIDYAKSHPIKLVA